MQFEVEATREMMRVTRGKRNAKYLEHLRHAQELEVKWLAVFSISIYIYKSEVVSTLDVPMSTLCMCVPNSRLVLLMSRCTLYVCPVEAVRYSEMFVYYGFPWQRSLQ